MLKTILEQYRNGERGMPTYDELAAIAGGDHDGHARINGGACRAQAEPVADEPLPLDENWAAGVLGLGGVLSHDAKQKVALVLLGARAAQSVQQSRIDELEFAVSHWKERAEYRRTNEQLQSGHRAGVAEDAKQIADLVLGHAEGLRVSSTLETRNGFGNDVEHCFEVSDGVTRFGVVVILTKLKAAAPTQQAEPGAEERAAFEAWQREELPSHHGSDYSAADVEFNCYEAALAAWLARGKIGQQQAEQANAAAAPRMEFNMADLDLNELERLALKATPQQFDTAEVKRENGVMDCPICHGEGSVDTEADYCNYDGRAIGVEFYGIGKEFGAAERYYRAARPAIILAMIARIRELEQRAGVAECQWTHDFCGESGLWDSACGEAWGFIDGGPQENGVKFCHGCGGRIVIAAAPTPAVQEGGK